MSYHRFHCPTPDCEGVLLAELGSFQSTHAKISACPVCQSGLIELGCISFEVKKSEVLALDQVGTRQSTFRHEAGLVVFTG